MAVLSLKIIDKNGSTRYVASAENEVVLVSTSEYKEGDRICLEMDQKNIYVWLKIDDTIEESLVYLKDNYSFYIPFGAKKVCYSPKSFSGEWHYLHARVAEDYEVAGYRNLAVNTADQHENECCYPHAFANVETRGESVFAAKNAIDGIVANLSHGEWPYESWGINMQDDAEMTVDFGRDVQADKILLYTRADFPHDNWWTEVTFDFSDGSTMTCKLQKSVKPHEVKFDMKTISWIKIHKLIKSEESVSPFPALSQIMVFGHDLIK